MNRGCAIMLVCMLVCDIFSMNVFADLYERAPDVLPGTLPEMSNPSYWIARMKNPDEVVLILAELLRRNEAFQRRMRSPDPFEGVAPERMPIPYFYPGLVLYRPDLRSVAPEAVADTVRLRIEQQTDYLRSRDWGNAFAVKYGKEEIDAIEDEMALSRVKARVAIRDGIAVRTCRLRNVPSFYPQQVGTSDTGSHRWDLWSIAILKIGKPVTVLHASKTGEYLLVLCDIGYGWVRSENIAFGDEKEIGKFAEPEHFVVCTGDRVRFYTDETCMYASGWFMMGNRLPLASHNNSRQIQVPVRRIDGRFTTDTAWLSPDADVHVGYLPYTRLNIVVTAFKLLGKPYDWTGELLSWQHETAYTDVFACFGFDLPHRDPLFTFYGDDETVLLPSAGNRLSPSRAAGGTPSFYSASITANP